MKAKLLLIIDLDEDPEGTRELLQNTDPECEPDDKDLVHDVLRKQWDDDEFQFLSDWDVTLDSIEVVDG